MSLYFAIEWQCYRSCYRHYHSRHVVSHSPLHVYLTHLPVENVGAHFHLHACMCWCTQSKTCGGHELYFHYEIGWSCKSDFPSPHPCRAKYHIRWLGGFSITQFQCVVQNCSLNDIHQWWFSKHPHILCSTVYIVKHTLTGCWKSCSYCAVAKIAYYGVHCMWVELNHHVSNGAIYIH